jgi:hypothetical protein
MAALSTKQKLYAPSDSGGQAYCQRKLADKILKIGSLKIIHTYVYIIFYIQVVFNYFSVSDIL